MSHCNNTALVAISLGCDINNFQFVNQENENSLTFLTPLFLAIVDQDINMIEILLALSGYIPFFEYYKANVLRSKLGIREPEKNKKMQEVIRNKLDNPSSLARLAAVNIAKDLVVKSSKINNHSLEDIKQELAKKLPGIAEEVQSIEDLFLLNKMIDKYVRKSFLGLTH